MTAAINALIKLIANNKTYTSAILAVISGLGMILAKDYSGGLTQILQALLVIFGGATAVSLRVAVAKVDAAARHDG